MFASIAAIEFHLPTTVVGNEELARRAPQWTAEKLLDKTGIAERRVVAAGECASDLAVAAAEKLFASGVSQRDEIDYLLFCTQSPDFPLPTTACLIQDRLKLNTGIGALDFNQGCSGYVYGLGLAKGLIETGQARNILLLTGDTYSRFLDENDISVRSLFGDGGTATLVRGIEHSEPLIGPFVYGTDGRGAPHLWLRRHALRTSETDDPYLRMNGPEVFVFALETVP